MSLHKFDIASLLSAIIGVAALADVDAFKEYLATLVGTQHAGTLVAAIGISGLIASQVLRVIGSPSQAPIKASSETTEVAISPNSFPSAVIPPQKQ